MFEGAITLLEQMYVVIGILFTLYLLLRFRKRTIVPSVIVSALFSIGFAWAAWYSRYGDWCRSGYQFEGLECYLWAVTGWFTFTVIFSGIGAVHAVVKNERSRISGHTFRDIVFWVCLGVTLFDLECQYFKSEIQLGVVGIISTVYLLIYAVPNAVRYFELKRKTRVIDD